MTKHEDEIADLALRVVLGDVNFEDDGIVYQLHDLGSNGMEVLMWKGNCCPSGEEMEGDRLVTCGKCHGYSNKFYGGAVIELEVLKAYAELPKVYWT